MYDPGGLVSADAASRCLECSRTVTVEAKVAAAQPGGPDGDDDLTRARFWINEV
jgi:hypothetical protein